MISAPAGSAAPLPRAPGPTSPTSRTSTKGTRSAQSIESRRGCQRGSAALRLQRPKEFMGRLNLDAVSEGREEVPAIIGDNHVSLCCARNLRDVRVVNPPAG